MENKPTITLTGILLKDEEHGTYMAFLSELPEVATEGESVEEASDNLMALLPDVLETKNKINEEEKLINGGDDDVIKVPFHLVLQ